MLLSKSKYLYGLQCAKYLWINFHEKGKLPEIDEAQQHVFDEGTKVGELATTLFPKGISLTKYDFMENIRKTKEAIKKKKPLFEAGFMYGDCYSRADILEPNGDGWDIIEVKSGTSVKDINIHDVSFQKYCYQGCGLKIKNCYLMHINKEYVRKGKVNVKKLFVKQDITSEVENAINGVEERIDIMFEIINSKTCPEIEVGRKCQDPYPCPVEGCWEFLPEHNVLQLYRGGNASYELISNGIYSIEEIPEDFKLNEKQELQKECAVKGKVHVHKEKIKHFLKTLKYPLYYLDFETFSTAIPLFDGLKPYQQVPFQYSLHVVEKENSEPKHYSFLAEGGDSRENFLKSLKKNLGKSGSVVVYNQSFEINVMRKLAEIFPKEKNWVESVVNRVVDLLVPFRNFSYYNPVQKGSASIKKVLPAVAGRSYERMEIGDGSTASLSFLRIAFGDGEDKEKVRNALEEYCCLDTLGMVWIVDGLKGVVGKK